MNVRPTLFEEFYEPHLSLQNDHTRSSCFSLPPVRLNVKRNFITFQSIKCFNFAPALFCVPICDYVFEMKSKKIVLESYGR